MFATVFFGLLDPTSGELLYINAGHEPAFVISSAQLKKRLEPTGPAVGMLPNMEFKIEALTLDPGDSLLLYTDGVTDAVDARGESFEMERLIEILKDAGDRTAQQILDRICNAVTEFADPESAADDFTMVVIRVH
jgi:serine phosphatase RsbU (regulator of sigma subunit)